MKLLDLNVLINAINANSADYLAMRAWLEERLQGNEVIALPWAVLKGFVRLTTHPKVMPHPLTVDEALQTIEGWLQLEHVIALNPTEQHLKIFAEMCRSSGAAGNLVTDAHLAALAIEHGCELVSCDTDFAKFPRLRWINPLAP